jgi:hypothetical protein
MLPLLVIIGLAAASGGLLAGAGAAITNLTKKPETIIYDSPGTDYYDTSSTTGGINPIWIAAGLLAVFFIMRSK